MEARARQYADDYKFRVYVTDALQAISENTTYHVGLSGAIEGGTKIKKRWHDVMQAETVPALQSEEDPRSCDEIAADIWARIRGEAAKK